MARRLAAVAVVLMLGMALALPATAIAGDVINELNFDVETVEIRATCVFAPDLIVTAETVSWPAECTGRKKRSGKVFYTFTITDARGMVVDQCIQQVKIPKKTTVTVGCSIPNHGIPVD